MSILSYFVNCYGEDSVLWQFIAWLVGDHLKELRYNSWTRIQLYVTCKDKVCNCCIAGDIPANVDRVEEIMFSFECLPFHGVVHAFVLIGAPIVKPGDLEV